MASQAYEIVNNLKDLPKNKDGFIEVVERYKNGRIKSIAKYLAQEGTNKEEAKKLCETVLNNVKNINDSIDVVNNSMNVVKGLAGLNAILGAANLCATAAGFAMMKQELNKVVKNVEDLKTVIQKQYGNTLNFKFNEVQGTYEKMLDKKRHDESFGVDDLIDLANKLHNTLDLFIKAFLDYDTQIDNNGVLTVILALSSMLSVTAVYLYQEYFEKYNDEEDIEMKFYPYRRNWTEVYGAIQSQRFKERLLELYFIDKDLNQYESTLASLGIRNQIEELKLEISDKEEVLRFFNDKEEVSEFMHEIDAFVDNQFNQELQNGLYSENMASQLNNAEKALQFTA